MMKLCNFLKLFLALVGLVFPTLTYSVDKPINRAESVGSESNDRSGNRVQNDVPPLAKRNNQWWNALSEFSQGAAMGAADVTCTQPFVYWKNCIQQGKPLVFWPPTVLYRGYCTNLGGTMPIIALQKGIDALLKWKFKEDREEQLTEGEKLCSSFLAGVASASVFTPIEQIMLCQQSTGAGFWKTATDLWAQGRRRAFRGMIPVAAREGIYAPGYMWLAPRIQDEILKLNPKGDTGIAHLLGNVGAGIGVTLLTQPIDMVKTKMQSGENNNSIRQTVKSLYNEGGLKRFWDGSLPRCAMVAGAFMAMRKCEEVLK